MLRSLRALFFSATSIVLLLPGFAFAQTVYYLSGTTTDQASKVAQAPGTASFSATAPTATTPIVQTGSWIAATDVPGDPTSIYWSGPFSGSVTGVLDLKWYWSSVNGETIALGGTVDISVFADPDFTNPNPQPGKLIGTVTSEFPVGGTPGLVESLVPVNGTVQQSLLIQVVPHYSDTGNGMQVYYGAASTPSSFTIHPNTVRVPFPAAPQGSAIAPRFNLFTPSAAQLSAGIGTNAGEPSIGSNWLTGNALFQSFTTTFKVSFDDSCPTSPTSTWAQKQSPITGTESFDPILYTDPRTGRTIVSQLLFATTDSASAFSDNDGDTWLPSQGAGIASGIDHQTVGGGGPFHAPIPSGATYPNAIYYCAQDIAAANCAISLDGGLTYGPAVPIYTSQQCGGLHGHIKVGPDGTAYLPNKNCGGQDALVVSEDNGMTWNVRPVPNSLPANSDPSVAVGNGGRVYFGFADNDHHPVVAVSDDHGQTWHNAYDVGAAAGIQNVAFCEMVAGDNNRAALAFLGTTTPGGLQERQFPGVWHMYVATTYDGGASWQIANATPNDPVQRGPIWFQGGSEISRNLLDFNDATIDKQGRILIGYADGCVGPCVQAPSSSRGNSYAAVSSILRQSGGQRMFAAYDSASGPTVPATPALTVSRNGSLATLTWSESNDGGSPVTKYAVYRAASGRPEALLANAGSATSYVDGGADPATTYTYRVTATNSNGTSCGSNAVTSAPAGSSCSAPGVTIVTDAAGDQSGAPANAALDIQSVSVAEPYYSDGSQKVVFTIKVANLSSLPASSQWRVIWNFPTTDTGQYYADMDTDSNGAISFSYGTIDLTSAVVTAVGTPHPLGSADADSSYSPDGTIRIVLSTAKIGNAIAGDIIGALNARTYTVSGSQATTSRGAIDSTALGNDYVLVGNSFCAPPAVSCLEDDDSRIAYSNGWHLVSDAGASAGHFRLGVGKPSATLTFTVPANQFGALTYSYAKSPKGGSAEVFIDGVSQGVISYAGTSGSTKAPQFGFSQRFAGLRGGTHTFEIRGNGAIYVDGICLESSSSNTSPSSGPGATTASNTSLLAGAQSLTQLTIPANAQAISVVVDAGSALVNVALVDPSGLTLSTADTSSGLAVINQPLKGGGVYILKIINASVGPVNLWSAATALVSR